MGREDAANSFNAAREYFLIRIKQMTQMLLAEDNDMIKAVPSDRTDEPFCAAVLPWRSRRGRSVSYAHCSEPLDKGFAVGAVPIANEISRRLLPVAGFSQLAGDPFGVRMCGHS